MKGWSRIRPVENRIEFQRNWSSGLSNASGFPLGSRVSVLRTSYFAMSLTDKKNALFGKGSAAPISNSSASSTVKSAPVSSTRPTPVISTKISNEIKIKKISEGKELSEKGTNLLKTTFTRWSPDYLGAAPLFEQSAEAYKAAEEYDTARLMFEKAAEAHEGYGSLTSAALAHAKAAKVASQQQNKKSIAAQHYVTASNYWATNGDIERAADYLAKAAKELEDGDLAEAVQLYSQSCNLLCPQDTPKEQLSQCPAITIDTFRTYFKCLVRHKGPDESLIPTANRMIDIFEAFGSESSMCKMMLTITFLELHMGDVVRAENTFLNVHLNNSFYTKSKECEVADLYVMAFKRQDITKLDEAKSHVQINYLDKEIQVIAKNLSLFRTKPDYKVSIEGPTYSTAAEQISKDLQSINLEFSAPSAASVEDKFDTSNDIDEFGGLKVEDRQDLPSFDDEIDLS